MTNIAKKMFQRSLGRRKKEDFFSEILTDVNLFFVLWEKEEEKAKKVVEIQWTPK